MADINDLTQNMTIWNNEKSKNVSTVTDGAVERLAVDATATITSDESPTKFQLKSDYDATGVVLSTGADTLLFEYTGEGVIDLIAVNSLTSSNFLVAIEIDGTERLRVSMSDLGANLGLTNSAYDVAVEVANKQFRYHPQQIGFTTGFKFYARSTSATPTVKHLVLFREKSS